MFVCFAPLYFTYSAVIPRDFTLFERLMSLLYAVFFILFLPFFSALRSKVWVNWGLAAYGVLIYLPVYFYPAEELISGNDPSAVRMLIAVILRGIYGMMQAPFAALSPLIGDKAASSLVYWILPTALIWPFVFKVLRFYKRAYLSEQLNPMPKVKPAPAAAHSGPAVKPEVLGTVITAPVVAASPDEVTGKAALSQRSAAAEKETKNPEPSSEPESEKIEAPKTESEAIPLAAPSPAAEPETEAIPLAAPAPAVEPETASSESEAIPLAAPAHDPSPAPAVRPAPTVVAVPSADTTETPGVIELGAPSNDNVENNKDTL